MISSRSVAMPIFLLTVMIPSANSPSLAQGVTADSTQVVTAGTGVTTLRPDRALVRASVASTRGRASEATASMSAIVRAVTDSLVSAGFSRDSVRTVALQVGPMYDRDGRRTSSYVASAMVEVPVRDFAQLGHVVDACLSAGASSIERIAFESDSVQAGKARALAAAFADARGQAEALALASGNRLDRLILVSTVPGQVWAEPQSVAQMLVAAPGAVGGMAMTPEDVHVQATVYARWALRRVDGR